MKYLCLIYDEEAKMATMSEADGNAFMGEYFAFTEDIQEERPLRRRRGAQAGQYGHHGPDAKRQDVDDRWPVCRDQGTAWRLLYD